MFKSLSTSLIARGILAVITGIIALAWPSVTVLALVILFAVYAFIAAGLQAARAFSSRTAGPVLGHLLLGLADLAAGVIALVWPGPTALVLVLIVGVWAVIAGVVEFFAAFASGERAGTRVMFILGGLATIAFGVVLCARPGLGAVTLALLFGLFSLIAGAWTLAQGIELRRTGKTLHSVMPATAGEEGGLSHVPATGTTLGARKLPGPHGRRQTAVVWRRGNGGRRGADSAGRHPGMPVAVQHPHPGAAPGRRVGRRIHRGVRDRGRRRRAGRDGNHAPAPDRHAAAPDVLHLDHRTGDRDRGPYPFSTTAPLSQKAATAVINLVLGAAIGSLINGTAARVIRRRAVTGGSQPGYPPPSPGN